MINLPQGPGFKESLAFLLLYAYLLAACLGDVYYTSIGLSKGGREGNPINRWLFAKLGQAVTAFLEIAAVTFTGVFIASQSMPLAFGYFAGLAVLETSMVYRNRKFLGYKKPLFFF